MSRKMGGISARMGSAWACWVSVAMASMLRMVVAGVGGADVGVVGDAHALPEGFELGGDLVGELLGGDAGGGGAALDLLAVLVSAGEEPGVVTQEAVTAREDVGHDGGVGVADVGARVDVIDRGGEVELFCHDD